jgi:hypothetical protein
MSRALLASQCSLFFGTIASATCDNDPTVLRAMTTHDSLLTTECFLIRAR